MSEQADDQGLVEQLRAALAHGAAAASQAALGLWVLGASTVLLGTRIAARAQDVGDAKSRGEAVVLETGGLLLVAAVVAALALAAALVLLVRWVRAAGTVLPLLGETATPRGAGTLATLWRAGGEAARPKVVDLFPLLLALGVVGTVVLLVLPRTYDNAQALDLAALAGCLVTLAAVLVGVGVLRRISDRHVARAAYVTDGGGG